MRHDTWCTFWFWFNSVRASIGGLGVFGGTLFLLTHRFGFIDLPVSINTWLLIMMGFALCTFMPNLSCCCKERVSG